MHNACDKSTGKTLRISHAMMQHRTTESKFFLAQAAAWPATHQVALVEQQQQVLVARILLNVLLQVPAARAHRVAGVQDLRQQDQRLWSQVCCSGGAVRLCSRYHAKMQSTLLGRWYTRAIARGTAGALRHFAFCNQLQQDHPANNAAQRYAGNDNAPG